MVLQQCTSYTYIRTTVYIVHVQSYNNVHHTRTIIQQCTSYTYIHTTVYIIHAHTYNSVHRTRTYVHPPKPQITRNPPKPKETRNPEKILPKPKPEKNGQVAKLCVRIKVVVHVSFFVIFNTTHQRTTSANPWPCVRPIQHPASGQSTAMCWADFQTSCTWSNQY